MNKRTSRQPSRKTNRNKHSKSVRVKACPSHFGKGYPKSYPMVKHPNGIVGGDFDNMTTAQWFNYHIEYSTFDDDPLPEGDYPIRPVPNDLDRTEVSFRDIVQYGLWCFGPNYERLTEEEFSELKKDTGEFKLNDYREDNHEYRI